MQKRGWRALSAVWGGAALAAAGVAYFASRSRPHPPVERNPMPPPDLPPGRLVPVPGCGELCVRDSGEAGEGEPTILLVHGWMFPADVNWFPVYKPLSDIGRVLSVDHAGHGRGLRTSYPFRLVDVADNLAALLRHLDTGPVVAVGYSMGGPITQLLWRRHPDVVRGLVQCATSATFSNRARDRWAWRTMGAWQVLLRLLPRHVLEKVAISQAGGARVRLSPMIHKDTPGEVVELLPWIIGELDRGSAEDIAEAGRELGRFDSRGWVGEIDVPTAVLISTQDALVSLKNQRDLASRLPEAETFEVSLDHDGVVARPDVFVPALVKAVRTVLDG